jgi:hypothetical protein
VRAFCSCRWCGRGFRCGSDNDNGHGGQPSGDGRVGNFFESTSPAVVQVPVLTLSEIPPASPSSVRLATPTISSHSTDFEDLHIELRLRDAEMEARTAARDTARDSRFDDMLKTLTVSQERIVNVDTRLQSVETQAFAVKERVTEVDRNEARAIFRQTKLLSTRMRDVMTMETTVEVGRMGFRRHTRCFRSVFGCAVLRDASCPRRQGEE